MQGRRVQGVHGVRNAKVEEHAGKRMLGGWWGRDCKGTQGNRLAATVTMNIPGVLFFGHPQNTSRPGPAGPAPTSYCRIHYVQTA